MDGDEACACCTRKTCTHSVCTGSWCMRASQASHNGKNTDAPRYRLTLGPWTCHRTRDRSDCQLLVSGSDRMAQRRGGNAQRGNYRGERRKGARERTKPTGVRWRPNRPQFDLVSVCSSASSACKTTDARPVWLSMHRETAVPPAAERVGASHRWFREPLLPVTQSAGGGAHARTVTVRKAHTPSSRSL